MADVLNAHDMTLAQFDVMATLCHSEGITQQELATRLLVTKGNVVGLIDRLCQAEFVERRADPSDRRANTLYLTDLGRRRVIESLPSVNAHREKLLKDFSQDELKQLVHLLQRLEDSTKQ